MRLLFALAALAPSQAFACGGFFCNPQSPVYQAGEEIVFAVDEDACTVSTHVSIQYEGAADDFAWIVPIAGEPDLFQSSSALFDALRGATDPSYQLNTDINGICELPTPNLALSMADGGEFNDGVTVVREERVGPYETVVLRALSADVLLQWLQTEGYDLPSNLSDVLSPYVADNQYFVALKLASGKDSGDLAPLGMRYDGCSASVPLQLTSIAANADMPVDVYVLGESRAVPDNYMHVTLNDASIDWWTGGANFPQALSTAADEAGGQAFSTTFSGSLEVAEIEVYADTFDESEYAALTDAEVFINRLFEDELLLSAELVSVLMDFIPVPAELEDQGVTSAMYYSCLGCYGAPDTSNFDPQLLAARIASDVIPGLVEAQAALDAHPHLTRLTTTMDPEEMTVDPIFVLNADLPQQVSNVRTAVQKVNCAVLEGQFGAERTLKLDDGRSIKLPSLRWLNAHDTTEIEVIEELTTPAAILIEDFGAEGMGEIVFDYRDQAAIDARRFGRPGCACTTAPSPISLLGLGLLLPVFMRRRG